MGLQGVAWTNLFVRGDFSEEIMAKKNRKLSKTRKRRRLYEKKRNELKAKRDIIEKNRIFNDLADLAFEPEFNKLLFPVTLKEKEGIVIPGQEYEKDAAYVDLSPHLLDEVMSGFLSIKNNLDRPDGKYKASLAGLALDIIPKIAPSEHPVIARLMQKSVNHFFENKEKEKSIIISPYDDFDPDKENKIII